MPQHKIAKPYKSTKQRGGAKHIIEIPAAITYRELKCSSTPPNPFIDTLNKLSQQTEIVLRHHGGEDFIFDEFDLPANGVEADLIKARQIMTAPEDMQDISIFLIYVKITKLSYMLHALKDEKNKGTIYWSLSTLGKFVLSKDKQHVFFIVDGIEVKCDILTHILTDALKKNLKRISILRKISKNEVFTWPEYIDYQPFVMNCQLSSDSNNTITTTLNQIYKEDKVYVHKDKFTIDIDPWSESMKKLSPEENDKYVAVVKFSYVRWLLGDGVFEEGIADWVVLYLLEAVATLCVHNKKVFLINTVVNPCVFDHIVGKFSTYLRRHILRREENIILRQIEQTRTFQWPEHMGYIPFDPSVVKFIKDDHLPILETLTHQEADKEKKTDESDEYYMQRFILKMSNVLFWLQGQKNSKTVYDLLKSVASIYVEATTQQLVVTDKFSFFDTAVWKDILAKHHTKNIMGLLKKEVQHQAAQKQDVLARLLEQKSFEWPRQMSYHHPVTISCSKDNFYYKRLNELQCIVLLEDGNIRPDFPSLNGLFFGFQETIKISYVLWLLQDVEDSRAVYELLKVLFSITLDPNPNNPKKLQITEKSNKNEQCLFKDIIAKHEKNIAGILKKIALRQQKEKKDILEAVQNKRAFVWPSAIPFKPLSFQCGESFIFDKLNEGQFILENDVIKPDLNEEDPYYYARYKFAIKISYICWLLQGETDSMVVYKLLKHVVAMSVEPSTNELILKGEFTDCLTPLLEPHKEKIKQMLLQKKQARMTLLTKVQDSSSSSSSMAMEALYVCGAGKDDCVPIKNSDVLLRFLNSRKYTNPAFHEVVFNTLQAMYPKACFLHKIVIEWYDAENNSVRSNNYYNDTLVTSKYIIYTHSGRNTEKTNTLSFEQYKREQIDACVARVVGLKPLIAIPVAIPGHANMLIIDLNKQEVEHFEPHGEIFKDETRTTMQQHIEADFRHISAQLFPTCTYIPRSNATNFQSVLNDKFDNSIHGGTCAMWSVWYAYLRLSHPEFDREVILKQSRAMLEKDDFSELERFIIKFMQQLNSLVGMYQVGDTFYAANGREIGRL